MDSDPLDITDRLWYYVKRYVVYLIREGNKMKRVLVLMTATLFASVALAAPPKYVCWDGTVVKQSKQCPPYKLPLVCPDGTIVATAAECPPVKICLDGTVTSSTGTCPPPPTDPTVVTN